MAEKCKLPIDCILKDYSIRRDTLIREHFALDNSPVLSIIHNRLFSRQFNFQCFPGSHERDHVVASDSYRSRHIDVWGLIRDG